VELQEVRLPALVRELRPTLTELATAAGVKLTVRVRRDLTPVLADPVRLGEIILNLVDNAVKYTRQGGRVELAARNGDGRIDVVVSDTGVGIPNEVGEHIFEPFYRVKGTRTQGSQPSSGLGLAVTKHLVDAHGGAISYHPRDGGGTVFVVTLDAFPA
jgi:signal transduction histidine kinase